MPSAARYAREKARAAQAGTTPYKARVRSAIRRNPGITREQAAGKGGPVLRHRARAREIREAFGAGPSGFCVVCGSKVEAARPNSFTDRTCGGEVVRRWRADGEPKDLRGGSFEYVDRLSKDRAWVRQRRADSRAAGISLSPPQGVVLEGPRRA